MAALRSLQLAELRRIQHARTAVRIAVDHTEMYTKDWAGQGAEPVAAVLVGAAAIHQDRVVVPVVGVADRGSADPYCLHLTTSTNRGKE